MRDDLLAMAVVALARSVELILVLLRDSKRLDGNDYATAMGGVDEARKLASRASDRG